VSETNELLTRREFLKTSLLLSLALLNNRMKTSDADGKPNFIFLVFDAWSARHNSLYGYPRETTPNLSRLAERAIVYHRHYAGSNWTVPGTASLLTGTYPWTHRSFTNFDFRVINPIAENNIFQLFHDAGYATTGFSVNPYAHQFLHQFSAGVDLIPSIHDLFVPGNPPFLPTIFTKDPDAAWLANAKIFPGNLYESTSLVLGGILNEWFQKIGDRIGKSMKDDYPLGGTSLGSAQQYFRLNENIDLSIELLKTLPGPFMAYFHFFPPHSPYRPPKEFAGKFSDGWQPVEKPKNVFSEQFTKKQLSVERQSYDELVAYVDSEIERFLSLLSRDNRLDDNTWVIITSDHGELFERGMTGHDMTLGYDGLVRVPLIIIPPEQKIRIDIYQNTSAVDILPTLLYLGNQKIPAKLEGIVLPPFGEGQPDQERSVFVFGPEYSPKLQPIRKGGAVLVKGMYKLVYIFGLPELGDHSPMIELFNVENDPEELENLYPDIEKELGDEMLEELLAAMAEADEPYRRD
jgi:arylsulfatase A-like enzyme